MRIVLTAWAGSLWTICGIVAPGLFAVLPDRRAAGEVAGFFFSLATWLGLSLGAIFLALLLRGSLRSGARERIDAVNIDAVNVALALTAIATPILSEAGVRPWMQAARQAGDMARFGMLHGASALLFAIACLATLAIVWRVEGQSGNTMRG